MLGSTGGIKLIDVAVPPPTPDLLQQAHAESLMPTQHQATSRIASTACSRRAGRGLRCHATSLAFAALTIRELLFVDDDRVPLEAERLLSAHEVAVNPMPLRFSEVQPPKRTLPSEQVVRLDFRSDGKPVRVAEPSSKVDHRVE